MKEKTKLEAALDELLPGKSPEEIVGPEGLLKQLTKAVLERAMGAEMTHHLGYEKGEEGTYWQQPTRFDKELDLDEPLTNLEPLLFVVGRFLFELCLELKTRSLAVNEVRLQLRLTGDSEEHLVHLRLPVSMTDPKALLKLAQCSWSSGHRKRLFEECRSNSCSSPKGYARTSIYAFLSVSRESGTNAGTGPAHCRSRKYRSPGTRPFPSARWFSPAALCCLGADRGR